MRVLVTGAAGYVGYAVGRRLVAAGHEVDGLVRQTGAVLPKGVRPVLGDLLDPGGLPRGPYDGVCHLAALTRVRESFADPLGFFTVNVQGTVNLLRAVEAARVVYGSTAAVYGTPERQPIPETEGTAPTSPYGASKLAAEQAVRFHARTGATGAAVLRTFNVAGSVDGRPDPDETRLIPKALAVAAGRAPRLEVNGDGGAVREYLHVDDLAAAHVRALEAVRPGEERVYNVGSGTGAAVRDVVAAVEEATGRAVPTLRRPPQPEPPLLLCEAAAIRADLGWRPARSSLPEIIASAWDALTRADG
ncbi:MULTISPECIES: NAD-dependent epimerase/dehydratase family protein [Actinomadura]|uniref:UDP-glucose 4-epimerase n=1 Tax=Actinomadura litoris TaxID=2678616 RepID=A0A7K1KWF5_9ACTN|nr:MULTISPECIES: NAD-dependent epimerase/dehydratase family protein [Actinomadura]MBT2211469.1 NAD-dependent epimerase/dehydratase family protein [Actinomadura sp. NEAU-AAG7]MUN36383.1 NAD-dependent epimerase/dehydratase family protein [Actinomadura litoris]